MNVTLAPCPICGALLTPALAQAVADPLRDESCPKEARR